MKTIKRIFTLLIILFVIIFIGYKLKSNKEKIKEDAAFASETIGQIPVKVSIPKTGKISQQISVTGTISAFRELIVLSETQGVVEKICKYVGDPVRENEVLLEVDDETIAANVLVAEVNYEQQKKDIERMDRLEQGNAIARHDLEQARIGLKKAEADLVSARKALRNTKIKASIPGIINKRMVEKGQFISVGMPVYEIVNTSKLKLWVKIPEKDIFKIEKGQIVQVNIPAFPGKSFQGLIHAMGEKADDVLKFDVEIEINNTEKGKRLKAGLFAEVLIPVESTETILIEKSAIIGSLKNPSVFIVQNNKAVKKEIITNKSDDKFIEVIRGLTKGEQVIVSGQLNLHDGDYVKIIR